MANTEEISQSTPPSTYLTFTLGDEIFAADVTHVLEVMEYRKITRVPRTPEFMRGVIHLRSRVVPVMDLRFKLGLGLTEETPDTCIVMLELPAKGGTTVIGALADSVVEVDELADSEIEPPPEAGGRIHAALVRGLGKRGDELIQILNLDKVFPADELSAAEPDSPRDG